LLDCSTEEKEGSEVRKGTSLLVAALFWLSGFCGPAVAERVVVEELPCAFTLVGHDSAVVYLKFLVSSGPMILLSASEDGTIILWSLWDDILSYPGGAGDIPPQRLATIRGSVDVALGLEGPSAKANVGTSLWLYAEPAALSRSQISLRAGNDSSGMARSWYSLSGHADDVTCLEFSPRVEFLVSGSRDGAIKLWVLYRVVASSRSALMSYPFEWTGPLKKWPSAGPSIDAFTALVARVQALELREVATPAPASAVAPTPTIPAPSSSSLDGLIDAVNDMVRAVSDLDGRVARLERALGDFPATNLIWEIDNIRWEMERIWDSIEALQY